MVSSAYLFAYAYPSVVRERVPHSVGMAKHPSDIENEHLS